MDAVRSFVALPVDADVRAALAEAGRQLARKPWGDRVRWVPADRMHLTLQFLGDLALDRVDPVAEALAQGSAGSGPIELSLDRVTAFPSPARARVIVAMLEADEGLADLVARVASALAAVGLPPEERPFRPHVTLGRVRRPPLRGARVEATLPPLRFEVRELILFQSELTPRGARYGALRRVALD